MEKNKPNIVFMGTPAFATGILTYLLEQGYPVCGVVTVPDKAAGRGLAPRPSDVKQCALAHHLPLLQPTSLKDPAFLEALAAWNAPLFVVVAFRMLPAQVWQMPRLGCFNLHASLLPQYRGAAPINHALINGEPETGLTTFLLDEQIDTGSLLHQIHIPIAPDDTIGTLHDKLMLAGGPLVAQTIDGLADGSLTGTPQPRVAPQDLKPAPKLNKEMARIRWNNPSAHIANLVRGLSPYPCATATLVRNTGTPQQADYKIYAVAAEQGRPTAPVGTILSDGKTYLKVACQDGYIHLLEVQAPGKKRMDIRAFLAGFRNPQEAAFI